MNKPLRSEDKGAATASADRAMLTAAEERRLARAWSESGDVAARNHLVTAFTPLARTTARRYTRGAGGTDPDLLQQAQMGLMKAADRFDPDKGFRFATYATWWMRAEIQAYKVATWSVVKRGNSAAFRKAFFNLDVLDGAAGGDGETDGEAEIARRLGLPVEKLDALRQQVSASDSSLNAPVLDGEGEERGAFFADPDVDVEGAVAGRVDGARLRMVLAHAMAKLPEREREIVLATQIADPPATLETLAGRYAVSKERIRQLRERALERLRTAVRAAGLAPEEAG